MATNKEFMEDQLKVPGIPRFGLPDLLRVGAWVGVVFGIMTGWLMRMRDLPYSTRETMYVRLLGDVWVNAMRAVALPLLICTIIVSIYDLSVISTFHLGWQMVVILTLMRLTLGVQNGMIAYKSRAGEMTTSVGEGPGDRIGETPCRCTPGDAVLDMLRNLFADNPVEALVRIIHTRLIPPWDAEEGTGDLYAYTEGAAEHYYVANLLGISLSCVAVGVAAVLLREHTYSLMLAIRVVKDACIEMVEWLLVGSAPFLCLCAAADIASAYDIKDHYDRMWAYLHTILWQLLILILLVYPLALALTAARRGKRVFAGWYLIWYTSEALLTACASHSSHVAFPLMLRALKDIQGIDYSASALVLALMSIYLNDGTAVYLSVASTWAAQDQNTETLKHTSGYILSTVLSQVGSVSAAGESRMHSPLLVMIAASLRADTRPQDLGPIMVWDWLTDACVSAVNICGSFFAALILGYYSNRRKLKRLMIGRAVNEPVDIPPQPDLSDTGLLRKPLDKEVYPPTEDLELEELRAKNQAKKEKRRAKQAEKEAAFGDKEAKRAKQKAKEAELAADEADKRRQEAQEKADNA